MAAPQAQALPLALSDIETLVKTLYDPGHARKIPETEATLRVLQRSPQGWEIGDALLNSTDENVRFFGALTLTVKVNVDSANLNEEESAQLLSKLIFHLVTHPNSSPSTRKLCSTLAQYFTKPISSWTECIRSLAISFALQQPILDDTLESHPSTWDVIPQLPDEQLLTLLDFTMNLADETKKLSNSPDQKPHERMIANVESVEVLLQVAFGRGIKYLSTPPDDPNYDRFLQVGEKLCAASLKSFLVSCMHREKKLNVSSPNASPPISDLVAFLRGISHNWIRWPDVKILEICLCVGWIFYAQSEFKNVPEKLRYLRSITELALSCLDHQVDDAMEFVADVLEGYPKFFQSKDLYILWTIITSQWGLDILKDLDVETVSLARIIVGYGTELVETKKLYQEPEDPHHQQVLTFLHELLKYPEPVGVEDEVALLALDFWSTYISAIAEESFMYSEGEHPTWFVSARSNSFQAIAELVRKITYPPTEITKTWDSDSKKTFKVFRMDVRDITMEAFELLRNDLTDQFVDFSVHALEAKQWFELEAGLFCLISLADALTAVDDKLSRLFERPLFSTISENAHIPAVARRTAVDLVAAFNHFFMRNPRFLSQVLPFLLGALAQPSLAQGAARSFASLCSECRKTLTGELPSFFQMYDQFLTYATAEEITKSKVLEGIAAIVQAESSEEKQLAGLQHLFQYVAHDAMQALNLTKDGNNPEQGLVLALTALKCLACVGRALQAPDEGVVDLDRPDNGSRFWTQGPGKNIQTQVLNFITYLTQIFPANDEVIESSCNVLRAGFKEMVPGPFVLPPAAAVDYIVRTNLQTPRLTYVLETACCWISCHKGSSEFEVQAQRLLHYDLGIMQALQHPRNEPEVSVGCIELIQSFIKHNASILKSEHPDVLKGTFDFSIECIKSPESLPKRAAASLWRDIIEKISRTGSADQAMCQEILDHFGQAVTAALIANICGEVDASNLEHIVLPLRKLIQNDRHSKAYIIEALSKQPLLQQTQGEQSIQDMVRKFTESLMRNAKNSTAFKEAVKTFWQSCKQLQMQLAPQMMHPGHRFNF